MILPVLDRAMLYFISGLLAGLLESTGLLDPGRHSDNVETVQAIAGPIIIIVTIALGYKHEKHKLAQGLPEEKSQYKLQGLFDWIRSIKGKLFVEQPTEVQQQQ